LNPEKNREKPEAEQMERICSWCTKAGDEEAIEREQRAME